MTEQPVNSAHRYPQLDALRGLAALVVMLFHVFHETVLESSPLGHFFHLASWTPLYLLWAGHEAVMIFFVLSGFVLTLMLSRPTRYSAYALKRFTRLYIPYAVAILAAAGLKEALHGPLSGVSAWAQLSWAGPVSPTVLLQHLLFVGTFDTVRLDLVIWSLVHEMRISLLFPVLLLALTRWGARRTLWATAGLGILAQLGVLLYSGTVAADWLHTVGYLLPFVVGATLAQSRTVLGHWGASLGTRRRTGLWVLAALLLTYGGRILSHLHGDWSVLNDWPLILGAALIIALLVASPQAAATIQGGPTAWLGLVSYSLYLWHPVVLLTALHMFSGRLPLISLLVGVAAVSLLAAQLSFRLLERPSIVWARGIDSYTRSPKSRSPAIDQS